MYRIIGSVSFTKQIAPMVERLIEDGVRPPLKALSMALDRLTTCPECGCPLRFTGPECHGHCTSCNQRGQ